MIYEPLTLAAIPALTVADYLGKTFSCACGKEHRAPIEKVVVQADALALLPTFLKEKGYQTPYLIADNITDAVAGSALYQRLRLTVPQCHYRVLNRKGELSPDEKAVGEVLLHMPQGCDVLIGIGSGVINDLCKFISSVAKIPYVIVATAASMDGYASNVSAMTVGKMKTTLPTTLPTAIFADTTILAQAPKQMTAAGFGDLIGKYSSVSDWKLSQVINGEYYCEAIAQMMLHTAGQVAALAEAIGNAEETAIKALMEGLVLSGIAMSFVGNSRPASGSEHHIAHFFEMYFEAIGHAPVPHGVKVGVNTVLTAELREQLLNEEPDFEKEFVFNYDNWAKGILTYYPTSYKSILMQNQKYEINSVEKRNERIKVIQEKWKEIRNALAICPAAHEISTLLEKAGAPSDTAVYQVQENLIGAALVYSKEVRPRYTVLQLIWDLH